MLTWVCSISLLTVVVAHFHTGAEQATIILMPTKIQIIFSSSVNPILLRSVLGTVLAIDSVMLKMEWFVITAVWSSCSQPFPSGGSYGICKTTQEPASDTESVALLS